MHLCGVTGNLYCHGYIHTYISDLTFGLFFFFGMLVCLQMFHLRHRVYGEDLWSNFCECFNLDLGLKPLQYKLGPGT